MVRRSDGARPCRGQSPGPRQERPVRRQVSWLAGHGTMHAFPGFAIGRPARPVAAPLGRKAGSQCIALAAYSCRDSRGFGRRVPSRPHRIPQLSLLCGDTGAIDETGLTPGFAPAPSASTDRRQPNLPRSSSPGFAGVKAVSSNRPATRQIFGLQRLGWGGRIRTCGCRYQKPVPYRLATPQGRGCGFYALAPRWQAVTPAPRRQDVTHGACSAQTRTAS